MLKNLRLFTRYHFVVPVIISVCAAGSSLAENTIAAQLKLQPIGIDATVLSKLCFENREKGMAEKTVVIPEGILEYENDTCRLLNYAPVTSKLDELQLAEEISNLQNELEQAQSRENGWSTFTDELQATLALLEQQLAEALAAKVKAEGERQNLTEDLQAALAARLAADALADERLSALEQREILLAEARKSLGVSEDLSEKRANELIEAAKQQELLNQQVATLRAELGKLQELLALSEQKDADSQIQLQNLGNRLNAALARAASEERKRRKLQEVERNRLADQVKDLANYKSEFFGRLREILAGQEGVKIVGDRFVFSSEVLFEPGAASLSEAGQLEIDKVANILLGVKDSIPDTIEWVIRVDGHTDDTELSGNGRYLDNWELSQARALSVVRYIIETHQFPANRMAANGFGEYQPIAKGNTHDARSLNRRIEIKLSER